MSLSFRPISARLASRVLRRSLIESAERSIEIAPATTWEVEPPIILPGQAERIIGYHSDSSPSVSLSRLTQRSIEQGPTRMHLVRNAYVSGGAVMTRTAYDRIAAGSRRPALRRPAVEIAECALCSTHMTERYFGHWLKDGVAHELLAVDEGLSPIVMDVTRYAHRPAYREMLGLYPKETRDAHCDRLWIFEDHEMNAHFVARYERLRQRIGQQKPATKIFLARGSGVSRPLLNEDEIRAALPDFTFINPDEATASEIAEALSKASLVVAPEGSAISHAMIAMPRNSTLLTIIGAQHFNMLYKGLCDALGIRFALTIADSCGDGFKQPVGPLLDTIAAANR